MVDRGNTIKNINRCLPEAKKCTWKPQWATTTDLIEWLYYGFKLAYLLYTLTIPSAIMHVKQGEFSYTAGEMKLQDSLTVSYEVKNTLIYTTNPLLGI